MRKIDFSSSSSIHSALNQNLAHITGTESSVNTGDWPLFLRYSQFSNFPPIVHLIPLVFFVIQSMLVSLKFQYKGGFYETNIIQAIFLFHYLGDLSSTVITGVIISTVVVLVSLWMMLVYVDYKKRKISQKSNLIIIGIFGHVVLPILVVSCSFISGYHVMTLFQSATPTFIICAIYEFIAAFFGGCLMIFYERFSISSVYFLHSYTCYWDASFYMTSYILLSVCAFFANFAALFALIIQVFIIVVHAFFYVCQIYLLIKLPCVLKIGNAIHFSLAITCIICDIMFFVTDNLLVLTLFPIFLFIVLTIINYIILKKVVIKLIERPVTNQQQLLLKLKLAFTEHHSSFVEGKLIESAYKSPLIDKNGKLVIARLCSYFPQYDNILLSLLEDLFSENSMGFYDQFSIYTINIANCTRQTIIQLNDLNDVKDKSNLLTQTLRHFWKGLMEIPYCPNGYSTFSKISKEINEIDEFWSDEIEIYPLSTIVSQSYSNYLIENHCDFESGAFWAYKTNQLQMGNIFDLEYLTISFLHMFPSYTDEILSHVKVANLDDLDSKKKEESLKSLISNSELKVEFQRAVQDKKSKYLPLINSVSLYRLIIVIICWIVLLIIFAGYRNERIEQLELINHITQIEVSLSSSLTSLLFASGTEYGLVYSQEDFLTQIHADTNQGLFNLEINWMQNAVVFAMNGLHSFQYFISYLMRHISDGNQFNNFLTVLEKKDLPRIEETLSNNDNLYGDISITLLAIVKRCQSILATYFIQNITTSDFIIPIYHNLIFTRLNDLIDAIVSDEKQQIISENSFNKIPFIVCMLISVITIPLNIIYFALFYHELNQIMKLCYDLPNDVKKTGSEFLLIKHERTEEAFNPNIFINHRSFCSLLPIIIFFVIDLVIMIIFLYSMKYVITSNESIGSLSEAVSYAGKKASTMMYIIAEFSSYSLLSLKPGLNEDFPEEISEAIENLSSVYSKLMNFDFDSNNRYTSIIQGIEKQTNCTVNSSSNELHQRYSCSSIEQGIVTYLEIARHLLLNDPLQIMRTIDFLHLFHLATAHLYYPLMNSLEYYVEYGKASNELFNQNLAIYSVIVFFIAIISLFISLYIYSIYSKIFKVGIMLIQRLNPLDTLSDQKMVSFLIEIKNNEHERAKSAEKDVFDNISRAIILINKNGTIFSMNSAFQSLFGYDHAHIIGSTFDKFIKEEKAIEYLNNIIQENQSSGYIQTSCKKENGSHIDVEIYISDLLPGTVDHSFMFSFTSLSDEKRLQKKLEELTNSNEIIMKSLHLDILKNKSEILIKNATIILIKINEFNLNAGLAEICLMTTELWKNCEKILRKYSNLYKVYLNNNILCVVVPNDPDDIINNNIDAFNFINECFRQCETETSLLLTASMEYGNDIKIMEINSENKLVNLIFGKAYDTAFKLLQYAVVNRVSVGPNVYTSIGTLNNCNVEEKRNDVVGNFYEIWSVE